MTIEHHESIFALEEQQPDHLRVVHLQEGHRYTFHVAEARDRRRVVSPSGHTSENPNAVHSADHFAADTRLFAEREARRLQFVD